MIDFECELHIGAVNTGVTILGTFETSFGHITAIHMDNGPTLHPTKRLYSDMDRFTALIATQLADRYRDAIDAEHDQQVRDVADTHPYRAARDRVYADLMGIPAL